MHYCYQTSAFWSPANSGSVETSYLQVESYKCYMELHFMIAVAPVSLLTDTKCSSNVILSISLHPNSHAFLLFFKCSWLLIQAKKLGLKEKAGVKQVFIFLVQRRSVISLTSCKCHTGMHIFDCRESQPALYSRQKTSRYVKWFRDIYCHLQLSLNWNLSNM